MYLPLRDTGFPPTLHNYSHRPFNLSILSPSSASSAMLHLRHKFSSFVRPIHRMSSAVAVPKEASELWRVVTGFTTFSSRRDVEKFLVEHGVGFSAIDAMLTKHDYCCGKWAVLFENSEDICHLESKLKSPSRHSIEPINGVNSHAVYASDKNINNRTVRMKDLPKEMRMDDLMFILEDYKIQPKDIEFCAALSRSSHYYVRFPSSDLAQRFVLEKNMTFVKDRPVHMVWYDV